MRSGPCRRSPGGFGPRGSRTARPSCFELAGQLLRIDLRLRGHRLQRQRAPQDVRSFPVAVGRGPERGRDGLARDRHELVPGPDEEPALDALAVRVLGRRRTPPPRAGARGAGTRRSRWRRGGSARGRSPATRAGTGGSSALSYSIFSKCGTCQTFVRRVSMEPSLTWSYIPPAAMLSSVTVTTSSASPPRRCIRRQNSRFMGWGNFGAPPNPPQRGSNARRSPAKAVPRIASVRGCGEAPRPVDRSIAS